MFNNGTLEGVTSDEKVETIIGPTVRVEGTLSSNGNINIEGEFKGTLTVQSKLNVGRDAKIEAEVTAENAFIAGGIKGNLEVKDRLELSNTAKIDGDVKAGTMIMEAGASLNGRCTMGSSPNTSSNNMDMNETPKDDHSHASDDNDREKEEENDNDNDNEN